MHQCVSLMAGAAVLLHSLALLLIMAGDVELNPGPGMDTELAVKDLSVIYKRLYQTRSRWCNIGMSLGVDPETLSCIKIRGRDDPDECLCQMLKNRLETGDRLTWKDLCDCLKSPTVERKDLAKQIEQQILGQQSLDDGSRVDVQMEPKLLDIQKEGWEKVRREFNVLVGKTLEVLVEKLVQPTDIILCLQGYTDLPHTRKNMLLEDVEEECSDCNNVRKVWLKITKFFAFYSYEILEAIIDQFGSDHIKQKLLDYNCHFMDYSKQILAKYELNTSATSGKTKVIVKIEDTFSKMKHHLNIFTAKLEEAIKVIAGNLNLVAVHPGCLELTYHAPVYVEMVAFPLSPEQEGLLEDLGIIWLECGEYKFHSTSRILDASLNESDLDDDDRFEESPGQQIVSSSSCTSLDGILKTPETSLRLSESDDDEGSFGLPIVLSSLTSTNIQRQVFAVSAALKAGTKAESSIFKDSGYCSTARNRNPSTVYCREFEAEQVDYQDSINEDAGHYKLPGAPHRDYDKKISNISLVDTNEISSQFKHSTADENNTLHLASTGGNISQVAYCLEVLKYDPNSFNHQGKNALHLAVQAGHDSIAHYLAQNEVSLTCAVENGLYTPLHLAALNGHCKLVRVFVSKHEIDPLLCTSDLDQGITPLQCACINGNLPVVKFLTEEAQKYEPIKDFINVTTSTGDTLLHSAALSGSLEVTQYLVESCNMKINPANDNGATPFHVAIYTGNKRLILFYMSHKDVNISQSVESTRQNALHIAAAQCHTDIVKLLVINSKIDPAAPDLLGCTPLHYAALSGCLETVQFLLDMAKDISLLKVVDNEEQTVFHFAVRSGNLPLVKLLSGYQAAVISSIDKRGWTPLHHAVNINGSRFSDIFSNNNVTATGDDQLKIIQFLVNEMKCDLTCRTLEGLQLHHLLDNFIIAQYLIEELKFDPNSCDDDGMNALHHACLAGNSKIVRYLIDECRCDLTCLDNNGHSVVHYACWNGNFDLLRFLVVERRCDVMHENRKGLNPLHYSACSGHLSGVQISKELLGLDLNSARTALLLYDACVGGNLALVRYLLEECNYKEVGATQNGVGLLQFAAWHKSILEYLVVEKGCDPSYVDTLGDTPLHDAMNLESFKYLLHFIKHDKPNNQGVTPLHKACEYGALDIVRYLVKECKADLSLKSKDGRIPIHFAAKNGKTDVLKYLIQQGCNPSCTDSNGNTPLHLACSSHAHTFFHESYLNGICVQVSHLRTVEVLSRDYYCNPDHVNSNKQTSLHLACQNGYTDIVKYLVKRCKCNRYVEDDDKMIPLFVACQYGWVDIVKFFADYFKDTNYQQISLSIACKYGQCKVVRFLVENLKCDIIIKDNAGLIPLWYACDGQHKEVIEYLTTQMIASGSSAKTILIDLIQNAEEQFRLQWLSPIQVACEKGDLNTVKLLVSSGVIPQQTILVHFACRGGKTSIIKYLIKEFATDINSEDDEGHTPLHIAARLGNVDVVKYLIGIGCDPLYKNVYGNTPAHLAALNGHLPALKYFIEQLNYDLSITNNEGLLIIHYACCIRSTDIVRYLVEECYVDINCVDQEGNTPLLKAAMNGCLAIIEYLIKQGCVPEQRNTYGNTPLHVAASNGHLSVVKYFKKHLDHDPNTVNNQGQNCLHIACNRGRLEVVRYLVQECSVDMNSKDKEESTPILLAALDGHLEVVKFLLAQGCDPFQKGLFGCTLADAAAMSGHLSVVKYLKEKGYCDFKSTNDFGITAVHWACSEGCLDIVKYLVEDCSVDISGVVELDSTSVISLVSTLLKDVDAEASLDSVVPEPLLSIVKVVLARLELGLDPKFVFNTGRTPLLEAASNGHLSVVKYLIKQGCDPQCHTFEGCTPLHTASQNGRLTVVKYFREQLNYDLSTTNCEGQMAIHLASAEGKIDVVQYLVEECAIDFMNEDKDDSTPLVAAAMPQDNDGNTPLHLAVLGGQFEMVKFYINNLINDLGLNPNTPNNKGATPLHLACRTGSLQMVKLFDICDFSVKDNDGRTLLHYVSWKSVDANEIIMYLVRDRKCDPAISDNNGNTCLHLASQDGTLEVVQLLVCEYDCDPNCTNAKGDTPLQLASEESVIDFFLVLASKDEDRHIPLFNPHLDILKQFAQNCTGQKVNQSPILRAIELDKPDQVNFHIFEMGCSLGATDTNGNTYLHIAALKGAIRVAQMLLNTFECDPNCENAQGATPLHLACAKGEKRIVDLLLNNYKCQTSSKDKNGQTPLHYAVLHSGLDIIKKLARQVCDLMIPDNTGHTPLHCAIQRKDVEILSFFLFEKECDLQVKSKDGNSYLHYTAKGGQLEIVHLILCLMPDLNPCVSNKYGCTPLDIATVYHNQEVVEFLQQHTTCTHSPPSVIHLSALLGHITSVQHYIADFQYDPDLRDSIGRTPLHYAAMGGHLIITQYLVSSDADPLSEDVLHNLPLHYAAALGHLDVVQFLVNIGSPLTARGVWDKTPAEMAAAGGHKNVLDYLDSLQDDDGLDWMF